MNPVFYAIHRRVNVDISLLWETGTLLRVDEDGTLKCFRDLQPYNAFSPMRSKPAFFASTGI